MSPRVRLASAQEEERLRREVLEAREASERVHLESKSAVQTAGPLEAAHPDGLCTFRKANGGYRAALERYCAALRNFSDLILKP